MEALKRQNPRNVSLGSNLYEEAYARGENLSQFLEEVDPTEAYPEDDPMSELDAFERQMYLAGIRVTSDPSTGVWSDKCKKFWTSTDREGSQWLFPEFISRVWRSVSMGANEVPGHKSLQRFYMSSDPVSDVLFPKFTSDVVRQKQIQPTLPLDRIVAMTTGVDSGIYEAFYLTEDEDARTMWRVGEGAEVPTAELTGSDQSIQINKYGRRLVASYETIRRCRIDRFALHVALLATQAEQDKVEDAIDTLVNGDGNSNAATNSNLTSMDSSLSAGDDLTLKGYLNWRMQWDNPYYCDVILAKKANILDVLLCNTGSANVPYVQVQGQFGIGGVTPIGDQMGPVDVGWDSTCPSNKLLGFDSRFALEMVTEIGSTLTETNKIVSKQNNEIVMTESIGFCIFDENVHRTLDLSS